MGKKKPFQWHSSFTMDTVRELVTRPNPPMIGLVLRSFDTNVKKGTEKPNKLPSPEDPY